MTLQLIEHSSGLISTKSGKEQMHFLGMFLSSSSKFFQSFVKFFLCLPKSSGFFFFEDCFVVIYLLFFSLNLLGIPSEIRTSISSRTPQRVPSKISPGISLVLPEGMSSKISQKFFQHFCQWF